MTRAEQYTEEEWHELMSDDWAAYVAQSTNPQVVELDAFLAGYKAGAGAFDVRWDADMRAIKRWQAAHPGKELTWPDHADLVVWLLEEYSILEGEFEKRVTKLEQTLSGLENGGVIN